MSKYVEWNLLLIRYNSQQSQKVKTPFEIKDGADVLVLTCMYDDHSEQEFSSEYNSSDDEFEFGDIGSDQEEATTIRADKWPSPKSQ